MKKMILCFVLIWIVYMVVLYLIQDRFLYHPDKFYQSPQQVGFTNFKENPIKTADGQTVMTWYAEGQKEKPAILFFHGNVRQNAHFVSVLNEFNKAGYPVLMMEYRGFGGSEGSPNQDDLFNDGAFVFDWLKQKGHAQVILYGYSIGTGVSMGVTQLRQPDAVVLVAPFASMRQMVKESKVPFATLVLRDEYTSDKYIQNLKAPLLILHGTQDKTIPYQHSKRLFSLAPEGNKKLILLEGQTHGSVFTERENQAHIFEFLKGLVQ